MNTNLKTYRCLFPDVEQKTPVEFDIFWYALKERLINMEDGAFIRFHRRYSDTYIETNAHELVFPEVELQEVIMPLETLWGTDDYYSNIHIDKDAILFNNNCYKFINLYELPEKLISGDLQGLGWHIINLKKLSIDRAKVILETKRRLHRANNAGLMVNLESENAKEQSEDLLELVILGKEALFEVEAWVYIEKSDNKSLNEDSAKIIKGMKALGIRPLVEDIGLTSAFKSCAAGEVPAFLRSHLVPASYLTNMIPMRHDFIHDEGISFDTRDMKEVFLNVFHPTSNNFNFLIAGLTGSGKSVFAQKLAFEMLKEDTSAVILDRGESFKKLTRYMGGNEFYESFNPMQFKNPQYLKEFITAAIPKGEISFKEEGRLLKKIREIMKNESGLTFRELIDKLEENFEDIGLYFEEIFPYFTDEIRKITDITYVDTISYPDKILGPLIIFLIEYFKNVDGRKLFIFDECWHLLDKNTAYIGECFRTFRKHGASAIAITQNFSDFVRSSIGHVIAQNSFYKVIFRQDLKPNEYLDEFDTENISTLQTVKGDYSEFYLKTSFHRKVCRYYQTSFEYELFTTSWKDNEGMKKFIKEREQYFSFKEVMEKWWELKYA